MLLHEEAFLDRLTLDNVEYQKDAVTIAKELLSLQNTRIDLPAGSQQSAEAPP